MNQTRQNVERGIYKQPGSPNFYISFADATGKIVRQSTGSDSIAEARRQRKKALADAENGKPAAPRQRKVTIGALFAMIRADYQTNNRRMRPLEIAIKRLHDEFEDHESAVTIVADRIAVYAAKRLKEGKARATVRQDLAILKRT